VGGNGGGSTGTAHGVLMEGAGTPDVGSGAMDVGVIDGRDIVAVPSPGWGGRDEAS